MRAVLLSRIWLGIAIIFSLAGCVAPEPHDLIIPTLDSLPSEPAATPQPTAAASAPAKKSKPEKKTTPVSTTTTAAAAPATTPVKKAKPEKMTSPATTLVVTTVSTSPDFPPAKPTKKPKPAPAPKVEPPPVLIAPRTQAPTILPVPAREPAPMISETTPPEKQASPEDTDTGSGFDNLELVDTNLKAKLTIQRVGSEPSPNNLLTVFAGVKNKTAHALELEIQTVYKDQAGNELNHGSWISVTLKPHEEKEYRSSAISTEATDFVVRIRNASN